MKFDNFYVIGDDGQKRKIAFNTRRKREHYRKRARKTKFVVGEVGSGLNFGLKRHIMQNMIHTGRPILTTYHASSSLRDKEIQKLCKAFNMFKHNASKKEKLSIKRATKYRNRKKPVYGSIMVNKSTIRNLKKYLSPYGRLSIKSKSSLFDADEVTIEALDENVFKYLYLYNSSTKNCISVENYIAINMMGEGVTVSIDEKQLVFFDDSIGNYGLAIEKGNYNRLYIVNQIRI